jgi:ATP-dependent helicase HrpB
MARHDAKVAKAFVTMASAVTKSDLLKSGSPLLSEESNLEWDAKSGKSRQVTRVKYGILTLESRVAEQSGGDHLAAQSLLLTKLRKEWPKPFGDDQAFHDYVRRMELARDHQLTTHAWTHDELKEHLTAFICDEAKTFAEISARPLLEWIRHCVGEDEYLAVERAAPSAIKVGAGHKVDVQYPPDSTPWIGARLQNFFGQAETPKIMGGKLHLTIHLLGPNMRAIQITTDLASFWKNTYPSIRNEYLRKYPRHFWPENPMEAEPPPMRPRRGK